MPLNLCLALMFIYVVWRAALSQAEFELHLNFAHPFFNFNFFFKHQQLLFYSRDVCGSSAAIFTLAIRALSPPV